jgi:hypothetical protein
MLDLQLQNTPSGSGAWQWHHFNRIDLTSPQFKAPPSHAQLLKPDKQKHNKIDLTSPNHLCKDRLKNKQVKYLSYMFSRVSADKPCVHMNDQDDIQMGMSKCVFISINIHE